MDGDSGLVPIEGTETPPDIAYYTTSRAYSSNSRSIYVNVNAGNEGVADVMSFVTGLRYRFSVWVWIVSGNVEVYTNSDYFDSSYVMANSSETGKWVEITNDVTCINSVSQNMIIRSANMASEFYIGQVTIKPHQLIVYWRNDGSAENDWYNLLEEGTNTSVHGNISGSSRDTILTLAGADGSRDSQGFLMNRQRTTNCLNLATLNDSQDDYVDVDNYDNIDNIWNGGGTFSCWIKTTFDGGGNVGRIVDKSSGASGADGWTILTAAAGTAGKKNYRIRMHRGWDNTNGQWDSETGILTLDKWHHIAITYNDDATANNALMYIDGELTTTSRSTPPVGNREDDSGQNLTIGKAIALSDRGFDGEIDDVCIYDEILEAAEVKRNYNEGKRSHK